MTVGQYIQILIHSVPDVRRDRRRRARVYQALEERGPLPTTPNGVAENIVDEILKSEEM